MKQVSKLFTREMLCDYSTDYQLNNFLANHPNYTVANISFDQPKGTCIENLFVVFNVEENNDQKRS